MVISLQDNQSRVTVEYYHSLDTGVAHLVSDDLMYRWDGIVVGAWHR